MCTCHDSLLWTYTVCYGHRSLKCQGRSTNRNTGWLCRDRATLLYWWCVLAFSWSVAAVWDLSLTVLSGYIIPEKQQQLILWEFLMWVFSWGQIIYGWKTHIIQNLASAPKVLSADQGRWFCPSSLTTPHFMQCCTQLWVPKHRMDMSLLELKGVRWTCPYRWCESACR